MHCAHALVPLHSHASAASVIVCEPGVLLRQKSVMLFLVWLKRLLHLSREGTGPVKLDRELGREDSLHADVHQGLPAA